MNELVTLAQQHPEQAVKGYEGMRKRTMAERPSLKGVEYFFDAGVDAGAHAHAGDDQVVYCVAGKFEERRGTDVFVVGPGDGFLIPPGTMHGIRCLEQGSYLLITAPIAGPAEEGHCGGAGKHGPEHGHGDAHGHGSH